MNLESDTNFHEILCRHSSTCLLLVKLVAHFCLGMMEPSDAIEMYRVPDYQQRRD